MYYYSCSIFQVGSADLNQSVSAVQQVPASGWSDQSHMLSMHEDPAKVADPQPHPKTPIPPATSISLIETKKQLKIPLKSKL